MRKLIIGLSILVAGITHAQDSFKYEPVANKAEYYVSTYNDRKDMGDYLKSVSYTHLTLPTISSV